MTKNRIQTIQQNAASLASKADTARSRETETAAKATQARKAAGGGLLSYVIN